MLKKLLTIGMITVTLLGSCLTVCAKENATVTFTTKNELVYSGVDSYEDGTPKLGSSFEGIAPGETAEQIITMVNANEKTVDFYMNADALQALEESTVQARGAGYDIKLAVGDTVLYDSKVGGYAAESAGGSAEGILAMNEGALDGYLLVATLAQGESRDVKLSIFFDGEAMDNDSQAIDYSNAFGQLGFAFRVSYEDPAEPTIIYKEVTKKQETRYLTEVVEIIEERVPLAAVVTGDKAMLGAAVAVLAIGVALVVIAGKKKKGEK